MPESDIVGSILFCLYCLIHRDRILQKSKLNHGLFSCPICEPFCVNYLLRMEAL